MLSAHRQADDEHSKIIGPIKVIAASSLINREWLKQGRCSKVRWVMPKQDKVYPCLDVPFYSAVCAVGLQPTAGLSCSELFSKEWFRPCVVGGRK